jgi:hypothetical protein
MTGYRYLVGGGGITNRYRLLATQNMSIGPLKSRHVLTSLWINSVKMTVIQEKSLKGCNSDIFL